MPLNVQVRPEPGIMPAEMEDIVMDTIDPVVFAKPNEVQKISFSKVNEINRLRNYIDQTTGDLAVINARIKNKTNSEAEVGHLKEVRSLIEKNHLRACVSLSHIV